MSKTKTRAGALLPVAAVFVAVMMLAAPVTVLSGDSDAVDGQFVVNGGTSYSTLSAAVAAATAGDTITLTADANTEPLTINVGITLNLS